MLPLSILDLAPITAGSDAARALRNTRDLARHAERLGFHRYWLAEHHGMPGIASAATAVVIEHVAAATSTIRVGAGGIMLPNHAPLVIAEQFGTLAALHPGRIDLGLGRAPGTDQVTMRAHRRTLAADPDRFPEDVLELMAYFAPVRPGQPIRAVPGAGLEVPIWILGSSLFGAQVAAALGLPFAFASHFAPAQLVPALAIYRQRFTPSAQLAAPYVMIGCNVFAADSDDEARLLVTSLIQAFLNLYAGRPSELPPPVPGFEERLPPQARAALAEVLSYTAIGTADTVGATLRSFVDRTGADELMIASAIFDHAARRRSYEIVASVRDAVAPSVARAGAVP
jgi:luciferase family oxidoreductase group 1